MRISDWSSDVCSSDLGIHAEPVTFGLKLAEAYAEFARCRKRMAAAREEIATCAISGAVGTFANIDPRVEAHVAGKLGLAVERSEERRVGKECVSTCRSRWSPYH